MPVLRPSEYRLSPHFLLSDLMGCSSVYERGLRNVFDAQLPSDIRLAHGAALATEILEPILLQHGPLSISYGFISPELSSSVVTYKNPNEPSYHRWDAGAACDICVHDWVQFESKHNTSGAPIMLAHDIDSRMRLPYSRLITYSESPYICIAANEKEIRQWMTGTGLPRAAFYENRFEGTPKAKPKYINMRGDKARQKQRELLESEDLPAHWFGGGFPSYHGGGRKQLHHIRTSRYTMLTDWLYNDDDVYLGKKNIPGAAWDAEDARKAFLLAGAVYDKMLTVLDVSRLSIVSGHREGSAVDGNERFSMEGPFYFSVVPPSDNFSEFGMVNKSFEELEQALPGVTFRRSRRDRCVEVTIDPTADNLEKPAHDFW